MKTPRFRRAKNSLCGRIVCRLLGEEKGAVLMEYVLLALLIAAAAVAGLMVFSSSIREKIFTIVGITSKTNVSSVETEIGDHNTRVGEIETANTNALKDGDDMAGHQ